MSFIISAKTTFPDYEYAQEEIVDFLSHIFRDKPEVTKRIFQNAMVKRRRLVLPLEEYKDLRGLEARNTLWIREAIKLQKKNLDYFFYDLQFPIEDIGMIISTTITGLSIPSLEAKLMNHYPFKPSTKRLPIFGLGCLGGVATIARANDYLTSHPQEAVLLLMTELCSLTFQWDDYSMANLVGTSLFADGAGAVLMVGEEHPWALRGSLQVTQGESIFFPESERIMGWDIVDQGFKLVLSGDVPKIVAQHLVPAYKNFLIKNKIHHEEIAFYISHPGGPKVLQSLEDSLGITQEDLELSYQSLIEHGNMSSVSVINVLEEFLSQKKKFFKGKSGLMLAMGPAFCAEVLIIKGQ